MTNLYLKHKRLILKCCSSNSLILGKLTPKEYKAIIKAKIPSSGSTGLYALPKDYNGEAPYIATFFKYFNKSLKVLKWKKYKLTLINGQQFKLYKR